MLWALTYALRATTRVSHRQPTPSSSQPPDHWQSPWQEYRISLQAMQYHGNNIALTKQFVSTCLLATLLGLSFILSTSTGIPSLNRMLIAAVLCFAGNCGVTLLWIVDVCGHQRFVHAFFSQAYALEAQYTWLPSFTHQIASQQSPKQVIAKMSAIYVACNALLLCLGGVAAWLWLAQAAMWEQALMIIIYLALVYIFCFSVKTRAIAYAIFPKQT